MKKKTLAIAFMLSITLLGAEGLQMPLHTQKSKNNILLASNSTSSNISYGDNNLSDISSANPLEFDNPSVGPNGVLERMPTTTINTKYGKMQITEETNGYQCENLSNPSAPILSVNVVNNIYQVGGEAGVEQLVNPKLTNSSGNSVSGQIILPNINTTSANFGAKYIEAIGANGAITIAPFIYNTVQFKPTVNVASASDVNSLTINDVLEGPTTDLKFYIANYTQGSDSVIVGVSRGMASVQQKVQLNIGNSTNNTENSNNKGTQNTTNVNKGTNNSNGTTSSAVNNLSLTNASVKVPLLIQIILNKFTYIVVGAVLIAIVAFFCFRGEK